MKELLAQYGNKLAGAISGWDRIRFRGTIRWLASVRGLATYMSTHHIRLMDFAAWAAQLTEEVRAACAKQAETLDVPMHYLRSSGVDKEALARRIAQERGVETGPICMFSVVEPCVAPTVVGNRAAKRLEVHVRPRRCVWVYQYWNDRRLGFGHTRLQTWLPFSATVCLNGRHWLERQLLEEGMAYRKDDNCFPFVADPARAQELLTAQLRTAWPSVLQPLLARNCPRLKGLFGGEPLRYYWSADETEWATDLMFRSRAELDELVPQLLRYGVITAQSPAVMRFLGRAGTGARVAGAGPRQVVTSLRQRYEGACLKHAVNRNSVKLYNKAGSVLRLETTINNTRDFKVFRRPEDDPRRPRSWQKMRKGVADMQRRAAVSQASNERYARHLAAAGVNQTLHQTAQDICRRVRVNHRRYRALNPWRPDDFATLQFLARGENQLNGIRNRDLRHALEPDLPAGDPLARRRASARATRRLQLLRAHGLIKKVSHTTRYVLTAKGHKVTAAILAASSADTERLMKAAA
jgi:hypothetical protein